MNYSKDTLIKLLYLFTQRKRTIAQQPLLKTAMKVLLPRNRGLWMCLQTVLITVTLTCQFARKDIIIKARHIASLSIISLHAGSIYI